MIRRTLPETRSRAGTGALYGRLKAGTKLLKKIAVNTFPRKGCPKNPYFWNRPFWSGLGPAPLRNPV